MPIDAKEIRVGNYVEFEGKFYPVLCIDTQNEFEEHKGYASLPQYLPSGRMYTSDGRWLDTINGILLTEELLFKCGFKEHEDTCLMMHNVSSYILNGLILLGSMYVEEVPSGYWINVKTDTNKNIQPHMLYLHQLQNMYWCLFNKELEINYDTKTYSL